MEYCNSLRALRESLNDPVEAQSPNTLCAVYLITICQVRHLVLGFFFGSLELILSITELAWEI
jgi:hypothetical protein